MTDKPNESLVRQIFKIKSGYGPVSAILVTLGAYFGSQLFAGVLIAVFASIKGYNEQQVAALVQDSVVWQFWFVLAVEVSTLGILWWFMQLRHIPWSQIGLGRKPISKDAAYGLITFGIYFVILMIVTGLISVLIPSINLDQQQQIGFENVSGRLGLLPVFVSLVILPPIVEEIMVRGFLFSGLRTKLGAIVSALIASILFAIAHLQLGSGEPPLWIAAIDTFLLSLALIAIRVRTGALWAGMLVHALKNGIAFVYLFVL